MKTDSIFYRLFTVSPETFFLMLGMPAAQAAETAARYDFEALEFKETSHRADGVFRPAETTSTVYFLEVQGYELPSVYADLLAKVYTYLKQNEPSQPYCGVVLFADRGLEPKGLAPYQLLIDGGLIRRFYLNELPGLTDGPLGLSILDLIRRSEGEAPAAARTLLTRAKLEIGDEALRADLIDLIETVIVYKLSRLSREEIQAMLQIHDIRESRVYREAKAEGKQEGKQEGHAEGQAEGQAEGIAKGVEKERHAPSSGWRDRTCRPHKSPPSWNWTWNRSARPWRAPIRGSSRTRSFRSVASDDDLVSPSRRPNRGRRAGVDGRRGPGDNSDMSALTAVTPALDAAFRALAAEWQAATRFAAAPSAAAEHPAYRAVVGLGPGAVPLILAALENAPGPWFAALRELTGADPVPPADRGRPEAAAAGGAGGVKVVFGKRNGNTQGSRAA